MTSENKASGGAEALSTAGNSLARSHGLSWFKATLEETMRSIECTNKLIAGGCFIHFYRCRHIANSNGTHSMLARLGRFSTLCS